MCVRATAGRIESSSLTTQLRRTRARRDEAGLDIAQRQQEEIERVEAYIRRYKEWQSATMAKSLDTLLLSPSVGRSAPGSEKKLRCRRARPAAAKQILSRVNAYGPRNVLNDVSLTIERAER